MAWRRLMYGCRRPCGALAGSYRSQNKFYKVCSQSETGLKRVAGEDKWVMGAVEPWNPHDFAI